MNAMRIIIAIVWLTGLLPGMVQASDADDFVAASRSQQTAMLTRWAATPEPARLPLLKALQQENLYTDSQKKALPASTAKWLPWARQRAPKERPKPCG